jgi:Phage capsid protein
MALDIDDAFVKQFESDVHAAYQRMGSKLRNTVRNKSNITGMSTTFQKVGKGTAGTKSRHGNVPVMSIDHTPVEVTLGDFYAADYIDKLDELKINHDERGVVSQAAAAALGRKTDDLIITAMDATTNTITEAGTTGLTDVKIKQVFEYFGNNDVPDDGERYFAISPGGWTDLLGITAFSSADFIGSDDLPYKGGMVAKQWLGFTFFTHSGLPIIPTNIRKNFAYHKNAVGHASGADVTTELNYIPEKVAHLGTSYMSQGAVLIDNTGVYEVQAYDI